jgi:hypothetical protein
MNKNAHIFIKIFVLMIIIVIIDIPFGFVMDKWYAVQGRGLLYGIDKSNEDILILGSSRARHHYISSIFEDSLKMTCYNLGTGGQNMYYHYILLKSSLSRYTPKLIIIEIDNNFRSVEQNKIDIKALRVFNPIYFSSPQVQEFVDLASNVEKIKLLSSLYRYNWEFAICIKYFLFHHNKFPGQKGYEPLTGIWDKKIEKHIYPKSSQIDENKISYLEKCIELCKNKGVKIVLSYSPYFGIHNSNDFKKIEEIAMKNDVVFLNFAQDTCFLQNRNYFKDQFHLNHQGAIEFTNVFVKTLKTLIIKN